MLGVGVRKTKHLVVAEAQQAERRPRLREGAQLMSQDLDHLARKVKGLALNAEGLAKAVPNPQPFPPARPLRLAQDVLVYTVRLASYCRLNHLVVLALSDEVVHSSSVLALRDTAL